MKIENLILRQEEPKDYRKVEELTREAFWNIHVPGCDEHYVAHIMRDSRAFVKELDIVAIIEDKLVGNIMYTKGKILGDDNQEQIVLCFGPISVLPIYQGMGIGTKLIEYTKKIAKGMGYKAILIYGDPNYYSKVGFIKASKYGIGTPDNMYAEPLQALELEEGFLSNCRGRFFEDEVFNYDINKAKEFDRNFNRKVIKNNLLSQKRFMELVQMREPR